MADMDRKTPAEQSDSCMRAALKKFFSLVSHDIKTQLATVRSYSELLAGSETLSGDDREISMQIQIASFLLQIKINNLVNAGRIESSLISYDMRPFSIGDLCEQARHSLEPFSSGKGVRLDVDVETDCLVVGDVEKIEEILVNLSYYVLQHTPRGGSAAVRGASSGNRLRIAIESSGGLYSEQDRSIISCILKEKTPEKGELGLFISAVFAAAHGAELSWDVEEGGNAGLSFTLPVHSETVGS